MKTGGGDFSPEAYEQLRDAYSKEQDAASRIELAGTEVMGQRLGLETLPVDSPWANRIENWKYPDGKSEYKDGKQSPDEILEIMRQSAVERIEAKKDEETDVDDLSDDEFDAHVTKILSETEETEEEEEETETETEDEDDAESDDSDEAVEAVEESEADEESEEEDFDADAVASQIAELRSEIEAMNFNPGTPEEETISDDESE